MVRYVKIVESRLLVLVEQIAHALQELFVLLATIYALHAAENFAGPHQIALVMIQNAHAKMVKFVSVAVVLLRSV